jgi:hypothetical protein
MDADLDKVFKTLADPGRRLLNLGCHHRAVGSSMEPTTQLVALGMEECDHLVEGHRRQVVDVFAAPDTDAHFDPRPRSISAERIFRGEWVVENS